MSRLIAQSEHRARGRGKPNNANRAQWNPEKHDRQAQLGLLQCGKDVVVAATGNTHDQEEALVQLLLSLLLLQYFFWVFLKTHPPTPSSSTIISVNSLFIYMPLVVLQFFSLAAAPSPENNYTHIYIITCYHNHTHLSLSSALIFSSIRLLDRLFQSLHEIIFKVFYCDDNVARVLKCTH